MCKKSSDRMAIENPTVSLSDHENSAQPETRKFPASLLQTCYHAVIKAISGCVCIACSGLMISLLQVVNRLDAS